MRGGQPGGAEGGVMTTTIHSNGSKWAGEAPDSIEKLLEVLGTHVLDRRFEGPEPTTFVEVSKVGEKWAVPGTTRFFGNFLELSHVFSIDTDESYVIAKLKAAIEINMARADYLAQPTYQQREAERRKLEAYQREHVGRRR
jgi:hypothetical protein